MGIQFLGQSAFSTRFDQRQPWFYCLLSYRSPLDKFSLARELQSGKCFLDLFQVGGPVLLDFLHQSQVLLLQILEILVKFVVPWVQNEHLERQSRGGNREVGDGESASDDHLCGMTLVFWTRSKRLS